MALVRIGDVALNVREWGDEGSPPILFWHALGPVGSAGTFGEVAPVLAARGWRVAGIDGPGFGGSPPLPADRYAAEELARLALGVADTLSFDRFTAIGHSWGGAVVLRAAMLEPERIRALVLLDSGHVDYTGREAHGPPQETPRWPSAAAFEADLRSEVDRFTPALFESYLAGTHEDGDELVGVAADVQAAARAGLAGDRVPETWPVVAARRTPLLLLLATREPHVLENRRHLPAFEAAVPHAEVRWVPDAGHDLLADVGPALGDDIADWLAAH